MNRCLIIIGTLLSACSHGHDHAEGSVAAPSRPSRGDEIVLCPSVASRMGVSVDTVTAGTFCEVIEVSGQIMAAPSDVAVAVAPTAGIVTLSANALPGGYVGAGASLAHVNGAAISGGDVNNAGRVEIEAARRELHRAKPLHDEGIVTTSQYNEILARYEAAVAAYSPRAASGAVTAPIAGVVTNILVSQGQYVDAGQPVAQISRTSRLTLRADVPERLATFLPQISGANIRPAGLESYIRLADLGGRISSGTPASAQSGYFPIYFTFNNSGSTPPGAFVDVALLGAPRAGVIAVPVSAITEQQGAFYVYIRVDEEGYERRRVTLGGNDGVRVEIKSGLKAGDAVVTEGAAVIRLAENSGKVPEGHSHNH